MSNGAKGKWWKQSWNPIDGCSPKSEGCRNCWAAWQAKRLTGYGQDRFSGLTTDGRFNGTVRCRPEVLEQPLHWRKPRTIFVCSMSDPFHQKVPFEFVDQVVAVTQLCPQHRFLFLTKRAGQMAKYWNHPRGNRPAIIQQAMFVLDHGYGGIAEWFLAHPLTWPLPNVMLGTTVENEGALHRVEELLKCPAAVKFLSVEPLLGPIDRLPLEGIGQCIIGGESGPGARECRPEWVRSIFDQCIEAGVPRYMKQWGSVWAKAHGLRGKGDEPATWPAWARVREYPRALRMGRVRSRRWW